MFVLSKIADAMLEPGNLLLLMFLAGVAIPFAVPRHRRVGTWLVRVVLIGLIAVAVLPWGRWLVAPLENRFAQPLPLPAQVDGIVILGGAINPAMSADRHQIAFGGAAERITAILELGRMFPDAQIVFSGGSGSVLRPEAREAPFVRVFLENVGFDPRRVTFEGQSRNTYENALESRTLLKEGPKGTWLLVTSAIHMPRAVGTFRQIGWNIVPYPVDYTTFSETVGWRVSLVGGLAALSNAAHEWLGLLYYRARGWSDSVFPAPL